MQALRVLVVVMGVMIVVGVVALGVLLVRRAGTPPAAAVAAVLEEPAETRIVGMALAGDTLAMQLRGGGPDRVVLFDLRGGRIGGRIRLAQ